MCVSVDVFWVVCNGFFWLVVVECLFVWFLNQTTFSFLILAWEVVRFLQRLFRVLLFGPKKSDIMHLLCPTNSPPLKKPGGSNIVHCCFTSALLSQVGIPCPCSKSSDLLLPDEAGRISEMR